MNIRENIKKLIIEKPLKLDCGKTISKFPLAYEISDCLVGSEMCIRDSIKTLIIEKPLKLDCGRTISKFPLAYELSLIHI